MTVARFIVVFIFININFIYCQYEDVASIKDKYPNSSAVFLSKKDDYRIVVEKQQLKITCNVQEEIYINKETGIQHQSSYIHTNSFNEVKNIKAYTMVPVGKKYDKVYVGRVQAVDNTSSQIFYDDEEVYKINFPSVQTGAILHSEYKMIYNEPHLVGSYYFADYIPSMNSELTITTDKNVEIDYKLFHCDNAGVKFEKTETKNENKYSWKIINSKTIERFDDAPSLRYYTPHVVFYITSYNVDGENKKVLGTTADLYSWYSSLVVNLNKTEDARLKSITDSLTAGVTDELEKVKKIFYWVQDNISYVAIEDGLGGFIPRDATTVCSRKYGDCKDMASTINEMLKIAGIKSYLTWIGSNDIPYSYSDIASPYVDNHMITTYIDKDGNPYFLDATGKYAAIDFYTSMIQNKEGLLGITLDSMKILKVPVKDYMQSQTIDSVSIELKNDTVSGKGKVIMTGYDRLDYLYRTQYYNKTNLQDFVKSYFQKGSNKMNLISSSFVDNDRKIANVDYSFNITDYVKKNADEVYINLNIDNSVELEKIEDDREIPVKFRHTTFKKTVTILTIPDGYKVEFIPEQVKVENSIAGFDSHYSIVNNQVIFTSSTYINAIILEKKDFEKYNTVAKDRMKAVKQVIILKKK